MMGRSKIKDSSETCPLSQRDQTEQGISSASTRRGHSSSQLESESSQKPFLHLIVAVSVNEVSCTRLVLQARACGDQLWGTCCIQTLILTIMHLIKAVGISVFCRTCLLPYSYNIFITSTHTVSVSFLLHYSIVPDSQCLNPFCMHQNFQYLISQHPERGQNIKHQAVEAAKTDLSEKSS